MTQKELLEKAIKITTKDRNLTHGEPEGSFRTIANLWGVYLLEKDTTLLNGSDVAIMMCLFKIARLVNHPSNLGNWVDLAGYAACGGELSENNHGLPVSK
jgi:hypothetical protein